MNFAPRRATYPAMTESPLIVLPADVKEIDLYRWHAAAETYCRAIIAGFGGTPLILPSLEGVDVEAVLDRVDGVLVPGSRSNVHPSRYGAAADPKSEPYDTARDAASFALIAAAIRKGVPLLAICRGMQELNVVFGGTLVSELQEHPGRDDHRAPVSTVQDERFVIRQDAILEPGGELANGACRRSHPGQFAPPPGDRRARRAPRDRGDRARRHDRGGARHRRAGLRHRRPVAPGILGRERRALGPPLRRLRPRGEGADGGPHGRPSAAAE